MSETSELPPLPPRKFLFPKITQLEALFKALAESTRMHILFLLHEKEMRVKDLTMALAPILQPSVSIHLRALREQSLVSSKRDGKFVYNSLTPKAREFLDAFMDQSDPDFQKIGRLQEVVIDY